MKMVVRGFFEFKMVIYSFFQRLETKSDIHKQPQSPKNQHQDLALFCRQDARKRLPYP